MHGGDEYGVPTVPTARKMAISVGGVSAPDIKTFLLGPGKTAFVARFKNGEEDSFDSDNVSTRMGLRGWRPAAGWRGGGMPCLAVIDVVLDGEGTGNNALCGGSAGICTLPIGLFLLFSRPFASTFFHRRYLL